MLRSTFAATVPVPIGVVIGDCSSFLHWVEWQEMHLRDSCPCLKKSHKSQPRVDPYLKPKIFDEIKNIWLFKNKMKKVGVAEALPIPLKSAPGHN